MDCPICRRPNPPEGKFCGECGARLSPPPREDVPTEESRRVVTILFSDVSGFTRMSERLDPEEVKDIIDPLFLRLTRVIEAQGGWVDKFMGDAIMAVFGVPKVHEDDPVRAVRAAWEMQAEIARFAEESRREGHADLSISMRIGINTGEAIAGPIAGRKGEYSVLGDAVNTAQRLESAARPGTVLVGQSTERRCRDDFLFRVLSAINVKGKSQTVQPYEVVKPKVGSTKPWGRGSFIRHLVGRDGELAAVVNAMEQTISRSHVEMLTIWGEAGIGKSRLLYEFRSRVVDDPRTFGISNGACRSVSAGPYAPFATMLQLACRIGQDDDAPTARAKLLDEVRERWTATETGGSGDSQAADAAASAHVIGHLVGMTYPDGTQRYLRPEQIRLNGFHAIRRFLFARGSIARPLILIFEDIHWVDAETFDLIAHLASSAAPVPVLILCTARPELFEKRPDWSRAGKVHSLVKMDPLRGEGSREMVRRLLRGGAVEQEILDGVAGRSGGNPFYVEEVIRALVESGVIELTKGPAGNVWRPVGVLDASAIPVTAQQVIAARLDGLPARERDLLQTAAVIGSPFEFAALAALCDTWNEAEIHERLAALQDREMLEEQVSPVGGSRPRWSFRHELIRDVAYEGLLRKIRRERHAKLAQWMETTCAVTDPDILFSVAYHYEHGGMVAHARRNYHEAGKAAWQMGATEAARRDFQKVCDMSGDDGGWQVEAAVCLARVDQLVGEPARGIERLDAIRAAADAGGRLAEVLCLATNLHVQAGAWDKARACVDEGLRCRDPSRERQADLWIALGAIEFRLGRLEKAEKHNLESLSLLSPGDAARRAVAENALAVIEGARGDHRKAADRFERVVADAVKAGDPAKEATALFNMGITTRLLGRPQDAVLLIRRAFEIRRRIGDRPGVANCLLELANACNDQGDFAGAVVHAGESAKAFESIADVRSVCRAMTTLGEAVQGTGDLDAAIIHLERAYELADESRDAQGVISAMLALGRLHLSRGDPGSAMRYLHRCRHLCLERGLTSDLFSVLSSLFRASLGAGNLVQARQFLDEASALARDLQREDWQAQCDEMRRFANVPCVQS